MMKKRVLFLVGLLGIAFCLLVLPKTAQAAFRDVAINATNFPDDVFRSYVSENYDKDRNSVLNDAEITAINSIVLRKKDIRDLKGLEFFTNLRQLYCSGNPLTGLDVRENTELITLECNNCGLTSLDVSNNKKLTGLGCAGNQLTSLDVSNYTELETLNLRGTPSLQSLTCSSCNLTLINLAGCTGLKDLRCSENQLTELDVSDCTALERLYCDSNQLTSLNLHNSHMLFQLDCHFNMIEELDLRASYKLLLAAEKGTISNFGSYSEAWLTMGDCECLLAADDMVDIDESLEAIRIYGATRYKTSLQLAELMAVEGAKSFRRIILVSGQDFPDGLSASSLAAVTGAPILTTDAKASRYQQVNEFVKKYLDPDGTVFIIGGTNVIPDKAVADLSSFECIRLAGNTRYTTNLAVLEKCRIHEGDEILIATGTSFPDSLSASATGRPLLLVNGEKGTLSAKQKEFLLEKAAMNCSFTILGGVNAISADLEKQIEACTGKNVDRIAGSTRYKTSIAIAERYFGNAKETQTVPILVYGENFPDALCAGIIGCMRKSPIILMTSGNASALTPVKDYAKDHGIAHAYVLGGPGLISDEDVSAILNLDENTPITYMYKK